MHLIFTKNKNLSTRPFVDIQFCICINPSFRDSWECPWARHFRGQPGTGETQESMNNVSCRLDMTEILLKAA